MPVTIALALGHPLLAAPAPLPARSSSSGRACTTPADCIRRRPLLCAEAGHDRPHCSCYRRSRRGDLSGTGPAPSAMLGHTPWPKGSRDGPACPATGAGGAARRERSRGSPARGRGEGSYWASAISPITPPWHLLSLSKSGSRYKNPSANLGARPRPSTAMGVAAPPAFLILDPVIIPLWFHCGSVTP